MLKNNSAGVQKAVNMLKPFAIEFQPFINDISGKEKIVQGCADMATMERIRGMFGTCEKCSTDPNDGTGTSEKVADIENLLTGIQADMKQLLQLNGNSMLSF